MFNFNQQQIEEVISSPILDYTNNLRNRNPTLQEDCFIRGKLAEIWFRDFFKGYGFIVETNIVNNSTDIDLGIKGVFLYNKNIVFDNPLKIEVKTSLIPNEKFNIYEQGDFKIYAKGNNPSDDAYWDIGIQVYYHQFKTEWESSIASCNSNLENLTKKYRELQFSCSWITKSDWLFHINNANVNDRKWSFKGSFQKFWYCPLEIHSHNIYESVIHLLSVLLYQETDKVNILQNYIHSLQNPNSYSK